MTESLPVSVRKLSSETGERHAPRFSGAEKRVSAATTPVPRDECTRLHDDVHLAEDTRVTGILPDNALTLVNDKRSRRMQISRACSLCDVLFS